MQGRPYMRTFSGTGADEDVVVSSARAYISALNKLISYSSARNQTPVTTAAPASQAQTSLAV